MEYIYATLALYINALAPITVYSHTTVDGRSVEYKKYVCTRDMNKRKKNKQREEFESSLSPFLCAVRTVEKKCCVFKCVILLPSWRASRSS